MKSSSRRCLGFSISVLALIVATLILCSMFSVLNAHERADAASEEDVSHLSAAVLDISIVVGGDSGGSAYFEKSAYNTGETVVLIWKGEQFANTNELVIPTSISSSSGSIALDIRDLIKVDMIQSENTAYKEQMGGDATITTYDSLLSYVTGEHRISLGSLSASDTITVNFATVSPVYRLYNKISSEHLLTTNKAEYDNYVQKLSEGSDYWIGEGIDWLAPRSGKTVKRLYNAQLGAMAKTSHYYTSDTSEITNLINNYGWVEDTSENWFMSAVDSTTSVPIYTAYSEALGSAHHYTSAWDEWRGLDGGWDKEDAKNGLSKDGASATGVISATMAMRWRFTDNYYIVEHKIAGSVASRQYISGSAGATTSASAQLYPGYSLSGDIAQKTIQSDNSTVVEVNYTPNTYKIKFNESGHGAKPNDSIKQFGEAISAPNEPKATDYTFEGWYYGMDYKVPVSWTTMPATDMTVYAKWSENPKITINFDNRGKGTTPSPQSVDRGSTITDPTSELGEVAGFTCEGWYKDGACSEGNRVDFSSATFTSSATLYANWVAST